MKTLRGLLLILVAAFALPSLPAAAQSAAAGTMVQKLADDTVSLLQSQTRGADRDQRFRQMMSEGFDVGFLGRQALGRNWRTATEAERKAYEEIFDDYMLRTITSRLARFEQETLKVTGQRKGPKEDTIVDSQILGRGEPIAMEWLVRPMDNGLKIIDVKIEGISMLITTREEFGGIVQQKGMQGLLDAMTSKIDVMKAQSAAASN
ncbi:ABC transporter substrate-binding protein [Iodidimonas sp. SYSU 1G8]|uniref:MlaC/ttg2D family ABC transporter substrate-binding protein n=1 Tax=Iodidimonas sp. SYSU 1G8 TaxID=3133967 RepID=UPI0031FE966C